MKKTLKRPNYAEELLKIIQSPLKNEVLLDRLNDYHERDIADALELLSTVPGTRCRKACRDFFLSRNTDTVSV